MAKTVDEGFRTFLARMTPGSTESLQASAHRASIKTCLEQNFGLKRFFRTGSFGNGTSVSGYSDTDYFAVIPRDMLKANSSTSLTAVRDALATRFPLTGVRIDGPAVVVPFGSYAAENTEVVPADHIETRNLTTEVFEIPDGLGGWMRSAPLAHNEYVRNVDAKFNGKAKGLIGLLKAWKYINKLDVSSFYLEMAASSYLATQTSIVYSIDLQILFDRFGKAGFASIPDPIGVSDAIKAGSDFGPFIASSSATSAAQYAESARTAESAGHDASAFYWWDKVFGGEFPAY